MRAQHKTVVTCPHGHAVEIRWWQFDLGGSPIPPTETVSPYDPMHNSWVAGAPCPECGSIATLSIDAVPTVVYRQARPA